MGVGLGLLLALWLQSQRVSSLGLGKEWATFEVPWFPVLWTAALGVLFLHDGALLPQAELTSGPFDVADVFHRLQELGV